MVPHKGPEEQGECGDRLGEDGEVVCDDHDAVLGEQRGGGQHNLRGRGRREQRCERLAARPQRVVGPPHSLGDVAAVRVVRVHAQALAAARHGTAHERLRELRDGRPRLAAAARLLEQACVRPADHRAPEGEPRVPRDDAQRRRQPVARSQALGKAEERAGIGSRHHECCHTCVCNSILLLVLVLVLLVLGEAVEVGVAQAGNTRGRHAAVLSDRGGVCSKAVRQPHLQPPSNCHRRVQCNVREQRGCGHRCLLLLLLLLHGTRKRSSRAAVPDGLTHFTRLKKR